MDGVIDKLEREYLDAFAEEQKLRTAVTKWMSDEAKLMHLRKNCDAPMWADYERARDKANEAAVRLAEDRGW